MILVDSSVWIDYFKGLRTRQVDRLDSLLGSEPLAIGDLILAEVLRGFSDDSAFEEAKRLLTSLTVVELVRPGDRDSSREELPDVAFPRRDGSQDD